jgi:hypothetical protein
MLSKTLKYVAVLACGVLVLGGLTAGLTGHGGFAADGGDVPVAQSSGTDAPAEHRDVKQANLLDHLHRFLFHLVAQHGLRNKDVEVSDGQKDDKDKPALSGVWVQKQGDIDFQLEFPEKAVMKITIFHGDKGAILTCSYTLDKEGLVKAKITEVEEKGINAKEKLPVGREFSFKWRVKDDAATIDDVMGDDVQPLKAHLEGKYDQKK